MERLIQIALFLLEAKQAVSAEEISKAMSVSVKTIRNDLKKLEDRCGREGLNLVRKSGVGVGIEGPEKNKGILVDKLKRQVNDITIRSGQERQQYIIRRIVMDDDDVTVANLAEEMYVTVSTVYKDMNALGNFLKEHGLKINKNHHHVLKLDGDEKQYRIAIANMILEQKKDSITLSEGLGSGSRIEPYLKTQLNELINLDYGFLETALQNLETKLGYQLSQEAYSSMLIHIAIALKRIRASKDILLDDQTLSGLRQTKQFQMAKDLAEEIGHDYGLDIPEQEIGYITLHILGSKMGSESIGIRNEPGGVLARPEVSLASEIAGRMIATASDILEVPLEEDHVLFKGLVLHLRPTINRLKYGLTLRNPILESIKEQYPDIFGVAWITGKILQKYLDRSIPESEIGYLALHIGAALERVRGKIKTLVICHSGIGTSQLLSARLRRTFKELDIIGITSSVSIRSDLLREADMILTTVPVRLETWQPIYQIDPLFGRDDVKKVENAIDKHMRIHSYKDIKNIEKELFVRTRVFTGRNQVIEELCLSLYERNYIHPGFLESVLERERIYSTEIGRGIVIPHGDPNKVKKSCLSVTLLKNPVRWESERVEVIIFVLLREEEIKYARSIFKNLSEVMEEEDFTQQLQSGRKEAMKILDRILYGDGK